MDWEKSWKSNLIRLFCGCMNDFFAKKDVLLLQVKHLKSSHVNIIIQTDRMRLTQHKTNFINNTNTHTQLKKYENAFDILLYILRILWKIRKNIDKSLIYMPKALCTASAYPIYACKRWAQYSPQVYKKFSQHISQAHERLL